MKTLFKLSIITTLLFSVTASATDSLLLKAAGKAAGHTIKTVWTAKKDFNNFCREQSLGNVGKDGKVVVDGKTLDAADGYDCSKWKPGKK